jgi:hypothetical protein
MGNNCKYVIVLGFMNSEYAIIFNSIMDHSEFKSMRPLAAGFVCFGEDLDIQCYGSSTSLDGMKSRGDEDAILVKQALNNFDRY